MKKTTRRSQVTLLITALVVAWVVYAFRPSAVAVQIVEAARGTLLETIDEDGETRVKERYQILAPMTAEKARIEVHPGDAVTTSTVLVRLQPAPLDTRQIRELTERRRAAERLRDQAGAVLAAAERAYRQAIRDHERVARLAAEGVISTEAVEKAEVERGIREQEQNAARFRAQAAQFEMRVAQAALLASHPQSGNQLTVELQSPVNGRVLRVFQESEGVIAAGTPLLEVGDPAGLEVVIDVLTTEAVKVRPGQNVIIDGWGGQTPLQARVRRVEPAAFTKISALGVEEKRVNVLADFLSDSGPVGDGYRLDAHIVVWSGEVVKVPRTALFRRKEGWSLFVVEDNRARMREVQVGHLGIDEAEVVGGVGEGQQVIAHPSDQVGENTRVRAEVQ